MTPTATMRPLRPEGIAGIEDEWRALEQQGPSGSAYLGYDWLAAWTETYEPRRLHLARVEEGRQTIALGLLERGKLGGLRFAGGIVTPQRTLLCAPAREQPGWQAFGALLHGRPRSWSSLEATGAPATAGVVAGPCLVPKPIWRLTLPGSFDEYLASHRSKVRNALRRKMRRLSEAGGEVREVPVEGHEEALQSFARLHHARARSKGEEHPHIDERMLRLLLSAGRRPELTLRVFVLRLLERPAAVSVRLDYGGVAHLYNAGFDPEAGALSPGLLLELASVRDAIERGLSAFDFGPGTYQYKKELGGVKEERFELSMQNPAPWARAVRGAADLLFQG
jgi:CelD/BcsL family acetyltransferase involved in cellulose biosynthesis